MRPLPFSSFFDDFLTKRRELESKCPSLERFDEATLPPRTFEIGTPDEGAWTRAAVATLLEFAQRDHERLEAIQAASALHIAFARPSGQA